jgi:hypothetical protein
MFPAVAALVSIYGIFADPGTIRVHLDDLSHHFCRVVPSRLLVTSSAGLPPAAKAGLVQRFCSRSLCPSGAQTPG